MTDQLPPQAIEMEQSILSAMIINPEHCKKAVEQLTPHDFYRTAHKDIFITCQELHNEGKPVDLVSLTDALRSKQSLAAVGGASYLARLTDETPLPPSLAHYINQVKQKAYLRATIDTAHIILDSCYKDNDATSVVSSARDAVLKIEKDIQQGLITPDDPFEPLTETLVKKNERDQERDPDKPLGYRLTRFKALERNIDGVQPGFYVVGGKGNAGKTAFICNLTLDLLDSNKDLTGIYFSLDDNKDVILNRFLSITTDIPLNQVQRPQKADRHIGMLTEGNRYLFKLAEDKRLSVRDASEISDVEDLELEIKRRMENKLFVMVDGLYNLDVGDTKGDTRKENIERANKLKALADIYRIPVICTGELRKSERGKPDTPPEIDDIMETGKFSYNANLVLLIYPDKWADYSDSDEPELNLKYAKNKLSHYRGTKKIKFIRKRSLIKEV